MNKKLIASLVMAPLFMALSATSASAYSVPDFGTCLNPQVSASQENTGSNHGVVGYTNQAFSGTDKIYSLADGNVMQCLCTNDGKGYQTNWLKATNISESDRKVLESKGWEYFADAGSWGLSGAYLAKTNTYECVACTPTPTTTPGPTATPTPTAKGEVLGLAPTGNITFIYGLIVAGATALIAGIILRRFSK